MKKTKRRDPEGKKKAILDAAVQNFVEFGFDGANTARIAEQAGCSVGSVFNLFGSKNGLANAVFRRSLLRYEDCLPILDETQPPQEQFKEMIAALDRMYGKYPDDFVFYEITNHHPFLSEENREARLALRAKVCLWIEAMQARGVLIPGRPDLISTFVIGAFSRLIRDLRQDNHSELDDSKLQEFTQLSWSMVSKKP